MTLTPACCWLALCERLWLEMCFIARHTWSCTIIFCVKFSCVIFLSKSQHGDWLTLKNFYMTVQLLTLLLMLREFEFGLVLGKNWISCADFISVPVLHLLSLLLHPGLTIDIDFSFLYCGRLCKIKIIVNSADLKIIIKMLITLHPWKILPSESSLRHSDQCLLLRYRELLPF